VHGSNSYDRRPFGLVEIVPATCLRFICHVNGAFLFALARGRMDPNVLECLAVRGWRCPNRPTVCTSYSFDAHVLGFYTCINCVCSWFKHTEGAFWQTSFNKLEGGKWQEAYLPHLLAD
jgi:hypothetical protein